MDVALVSLIIRFLTGWTAAIDYFMIVGIGMHAYLNGRLGMTRKIFV